FIKICLGRVKVPEACFQCLSDQRVNVPVVNQPEATTWPGHIIAVVKQYAVSGHFAFSMVTGVFSGMALISSTEA
ncbi:hypothetical protein, partial [Klebsiella quasipneumoniae]|uniref:hypothetical protein n=1 Tax=Klebsiella quasipneumoniae TaxID=1463165 RepID=UPI0019402DDE